MNMFTLLIILIFIQEAVIYKATKYTTIGNHIWFGEAIDWIASKMNYNKLSGYITKFSYSKLFICRPCHSFWMNLTIFMIYGLITTINNEFIFSAVLWSLFLYSSNSDNND